MTTNPETMRPSPDVNASPSEEASSTAKMPPPESAEETRTRRLIILSFWLIALLVGLPVWWKTTEVYRASLPLLDMEGWAKGQKCRLVYPLSIAVKGPWLSSQEIETVIRISQQALDDMNDFSPHHLRLIHADPVIHKMSLEQIKSWGNSTAAVEHARAVDEASLLLYLQPSLVDTNNTAKLDPYSPKMTVSFMNDQIPRRTATTSTLATFIASELQALFSEEQAMLSSLSSSLSSRGQPTTSKVLSADMQSKISRRSTRSFKYASTYHLTFSLFNARAQPSSWEIEAALAQYFNPLLQSFSEISNFTIDSQVQLYASFSPTIRQPTFDQERSAWMLRKEDLGGFVNGADWPLTPSIGAGPTINFILYIPDPAQAPLLIAENSGTSWLVPQWGGIHILNPAVSREDSTETLTMEDLQPVMQIFSNQLLSLLGLPEDPPSLPLRLSTLTRIHATSLLSSASSTLGALVRLSRSLTSIAIPNSVATSVTTALQNLDMACEDFNKGRFALALQHARIAEQAAETAFFERSMVGQVYFPDEHKIAVYLPFLGPVAVPLLMAAVKELRSTMQKRAAQKAQGGVT